MKVNHIKLNAALAEAMKNPRDVKSVGPTTVYNALRGKEITPKSLGKLAAELGVKPIDLIEAEGV